MKESDIPDIIKALQTMQTVINVDFNGWLSILENANSIWNRCPYKIGDFVKLIKTPEITKEKSWGWLGSKHFLVEGALAKIVEREFYNGQFVFGLHFQNESWIDQYGKIRPVDSPALYYFDEKHLAAADYKQLNCEAL